MRFGEALSTGFGIRAIALLVTSGIVVSAPAGWASDPRFSLVQDADGYVLQIEHMTVAEALAAVGARLGFRVVDLSPSGPRLHVTLRAPSVLGLLKQLLPTGGYSLAYRADGPDKSELVDTILLVGTTPGSSRGLEPSPGGRHESVAGFDDAAQSRAREGVVMRAPGIQDATAHAPEPSLPSPSVPTTPSPMISEEVKRFITDRVDILVDIARETTLNSTHRREPPGASSVTGR